MWKGLVLGLALWLGLAGQALPADWWVQRNGDGAVVAAFANRQPGLADEQVSDSDPGFVAFATAQAIPTELARRVGLGLTITSPSTPVAGVYALDEVTLEQVGSVARDAGAGLGLPGGLSTFTYPDMAGVPRELSEAQVKALYQAMRDLVFQLQSQAAVGEAGGTPVWPDQVGTVP